MNLGPVADEGRLAYSGNFFRVGTGSGNGSATFNAAFGFSGSYNTTSPVQQNLFIDNSGMINTGGAETNSASSAVGSAAVATDATHLLVAELNLDTDTVSLFLDPTIGAGQPGTPSLSLADPNLANGVSMLDLVNRDADSVGENAINDELRVGQTYASVTPGVPEPASIFAMGAASAGLFLRRRRRSI